MKMKWKQFGRIALGVFCIGTGVVLMVEAAGEGISAQIVIGAGLIAIGAGLLFAD